MTTTPDALEFVVRTPQDLGNAIAEVRSLRNRTQTHTAGALGMDRSQLAHIEGGRSGRYLKHILNLLDLFGAELHIHWRRDAPASPPRVPSVDPAPTLLSSPEPAPSTPERFVPRPETPNPAMWSESPSVPSATEQRTVSSPDSEFPNEPPAEGETSTKNSGPRPVALSPREIDSLARSVRPSGVPI